MRKGINDSIHPDNMDYNNQIVGETITFYINEAELGGFELNQLLKDEIRKMNNNGRYGGKKIISRRSRKSRKSRRRRRY